MNSQDQLAQYESQLLSVKEALKLADTTQRESLLVLANKLEEVIILLKGEQDNNETTRNEENSNDDIPQKSNMDDEFEKFQMEMAMLEGESSISEQQVTETTDEEGKTDIDELIRTISSLEGNKCRAPFSQPWGEKEYHNAIIMATNFDRDQMESMEDIEVEVMFCHPICNEMKPCAFLLDGYCKFSTDQCRFSHGYKVKFSELREFILPNYSNIGVDSKCLAQSSDGLWYRATIEKCLDDHNYVIKYDKNKKTETVDAQSIIPLDEDSDNSKSLDEKVTTFSTNETYNMDNNVTAPKPEDVDKLLNAPPSSVVLWEQHTKGIGSKLMEKMGHVWGQGLGKNSDGRLDPVQAVILPFGKSLDKCIEMRENCNDKGPVSVETRLAIEQDKEEQRAKRIKTNCQPQKSESIFDFLNEKILKVKGEISESEIAKTSHVTKEKLKSTKGLNIQAFSVGEDIKKTKQEISRLHKSLLRNTDRSEVMKAQIEKKINVQNNLLKSLQMKEQKINQEIRSQTNHKKLSIF